MSKVPEKSNQPVLVLSGNPAFGPGIAEVLRKTRKNLIPDLRFAADHDKALEIMAGWLPELLIVDREDPAVDLEALTGKVPGIPASVEIMLVTLHPTGALIVHDRQRANRHSRPAESPEPENDQPIFPNGVTR